MPAIRYLALLRGINVGGKNIIPMSRLKQAFERMNFANVTTYIQSGNVIFESDETNSARLVQKIERELSEEFNYASRIVLLTSAGLRNIVRKAPSGFGTHASKYRYDVIFLKPPLKTSKAMKSVRVKEGVDQAYAGPGALYFARLISKAGKSYLSKIVQLPVYQHMTIRNWNTTTKLLAMMEKPS